MEYNSFKSMLCWLKEKNINIDKSTLDILLSFDVFSNSMKEALEIILTDETIDNKEKWINILAIAGNNYLVIRTLIDILEVQHIRKNDFYVSSILQEKAYYKRNNLIRALKNLKIYEDTELYSFIREIEDKELQRRVIFVLEHQYGMEMFEKNPSLKNMSEEELDYKLIEMEFMLIVIAKAKLAHKIKEYVDKPNKKDLLSLIELQQQLESFFEHYNMTSFELGLPEVTKEGTYFEDDGLLDDVICSDCYFKGNCNMLNITDKDCEILSENSKTLTKYMK